jgi:hypothetical protein
MYRLEVPSNQRFFTSFSQQQICKPKLKPVPIPVPVPVHVPSFVSPRRVPSVPWVPEFNVQYNGTQRTSTSVETLGPRGNTKETCTCILVPRTCTSYLYLYLYLVRVPRTYLARTCTCTCTLYPYLYLVPVPVCTCTSYLLLIPVPRTCIDILGYRVVTYDSHVRRTGSTDTIASS